jgi:protein ImuA
VLAALRARLGRTEQPGPGRQAIPLCEAVDTALPGGGLARAALHEVLAAAGSPDAAAGFCALLLARSGGTVLWIGRGGAKAPAPGGLARFGLSPAALVLLRAPALLDALWAMEEALRCPAVTGALLELPEETAPDPDATRRLQLAAEAGGAAGLLLRPDAAEPLPGAAPPTRWRVEGLAGSGGATLGDPRWQLELLRGGRHRRGNAWPVVWRASLDRLEVEESERALPSRTHPAGG